MNKESLLLAGLLARHHVPSNKVNYYSKSDRLLESLPNEFCKADVMRIGETTDQHARVLLWRWEQDQKVIKNGRGKSAKYKKQVG